MLHIGATRASEAKVAMIDYNGWQFRSTVHGQTPMHQSRCTASTAACSGLNSPTARCKRVTISEAAWSHQAALIDQYGSWSGVLRSKCRPLALYEH